VTSSEIGFSRWVRETYVVGATFDAPTRLKENQKAKESVKNRKAGIYRQVGMVSRGLGRAASPGLTSRNLAEQMERSAELLIGLRQMRWDALSVVHDSANVKFL
jgi:hypothetical protein